MLFAAPGQLDTSFGTGGLAVQPSGNSSFANSIAVQPDGKILIGGSDAIDVTVLRLLPNGQRDTGFASQGALVFDFGFGENCAGVIALPDGKFLVGCSGITGTVERDFQIRRYTSSGALDTSFGTDGKTVTNLTPNYPDLPTSMALQANGGILMAGRGYLETSPFIFDASFAVVRYGASGALDTSFGTNGVARIHLGASRVGNSAKGVAVQPDGRILVAGDFEVTGGNQLGVVRFLPGGALDTSFANNGILTFTNNILCQCIAVLPDGRFILGGSIGGAALLIRCLPDGLLDAKFGSNGATTVTSPSGTSICNRIAIQPNGKLALAMTVTGARKYGLLARTSSQGDLEIAFAGGGVYPQAGTVNDTGETLTFQPDGKILLAGMASSGVAAGNNYYALRVEGDGALVSPLGAWRQTHFGTTANAGNAADNADTDHDGVSNLIEYAFNTNPNSPASRSVPAMTRLAGGIELNFPDPDPTGVRMLSIEAEWSPTLATGSWLPVDDTGDATNYGFQLPFTSGRQGYMRLRITGDFAP